VLTRLIQGESAGEQLSESELLHNCIFILNAGHVTTTILIGNALVALQEWPGQRELLVQKIGQSPDWLALEPAMTLAVDEFLRFESSNQPDRLQIERRTTAILPSGSGSTNARA
jgi:cytochrome P450